MVVGLGIDIVAISRIKRLMEKEPRFVERILTPAEREYCKTPQQVAGRWAAKEAVAKAVGLTLKWHEVEILPDDFGQPHAKVASRHLDPARHRLQVSITHERTNAVAVALLERLSIQFPESLM